MGSAHRQQTAPGRETGALAPGIDGDLDAVALQVTALPARGDEDRALGWDVAAGTGPKRRDPRRLRQRDVRLRVVRRRMLEVRVRLGAGGAVQEDHAPFGLGPLDVAVRS